MPLFQLLIGLVVVGVALYLVQNYLPISPPFKTVINAVVVIALAIWLLDIFGLTRRAPNSLVEVIVMLAVFGLIIYLLNSYVPMAQPIRIVINAIVVIALALWLLDYFGVMRSFHGGGRRRGEIARPAITSLA